MKRIIIIVVVLVAIALGGGSAWYFFFKDNNAPNGSGLVLPPDPIFLKLETFSLHVIRDGGVRKYIVLNLTLELRDADSKALAEQKMPKLRDVFIASMTEYFTNLPSLQKSVNMKSVKKLLLNVSVKAIGKGRVTNVLVQSVIERDPAPTK